MLNKIYNLQELNQNTTYYNLQKKKRKQTTPSNKTYLLRVVIIILLLTCKIQCYLTKVIVDIFLGFNNSLHWCASCVDML